MSDPSPTCSSRPGRSSPRRPDGSAPFAIEISPLFAADPEALARRVPPGTVVDAPFALS